ncbi:MAG: agmatine deiminase [Oceanospirillaceae bacterium]|jgi:agmatine deiminase
MPDESDTHKRTWMSFVANDYIWSTQHIPQVKRDLALIARAIAKYEPVSILVHPLDVEEAKSLLGGLAVHEYPIELVEFATDDLWLRDTGATFVLAVDGKRHDIDFNLNGWGESKRTFLDAKVAGKIAQQANVNQLSTNLVLEGGCFEVDGQGTAILTKSCVLNGNRNPNMTQQQVEVELKRLLGLEKIIWLQGVKDQDITDAHTDFYARFGAKGEVVVSRDNYLSSVDYKVTRDNIDILSNSTNAQGNKLKVIIVDTPENINLTFGEKDFAAGYIGSYLCNGAVIMQGFNDEEADKKRVKFYSAASKVEK